MVQPESAINRAKIIATLGPACAAQSVMREMVRAGVDVARINFSHGSAAANLELIRTLRTCARQEGRLVAVMQDLQGTKLRLGFMAEGDLTVLPGSVVTFLTGAQKAEGELVPVPEGRLAQQVRRGDRLLLRDGQLEFEALNVTGRRIYARALLGGVVRSGQGLTVPSAKLPRETLTEKDREDLAFGMENGVDLVALSHVRTAVDVQRLRQLIAELAPADARQPAIIVKIENHEALNNFAAILE
ncbi:MAG: pyruvate kinase, partial [Candidatus Andersenbacteria bacterium]|nr:pyruvate kinase [Candidatus Andersenbacteria bacterium]